MLKKCRLSSLRTTEGSAAISYVNVCQQVEVAMSACGELAMTLLRVYQQALDGGATQSFDVIASPDSRILDFVDNWTFEMFLYNNRHRSVLC